MQRFYVNNIKTTQEKSGFSEMPLMVREWFRLCGLDKAPLEVTQSFD